MDTIERLVAAWREEPGIWCCVEHYWEIPARGPITRDFPDELSSDIRTVLQRVGINQLFIHQYEAWEKIHSGKHVIITSGTSSGKSLCYQLPIMESLVTTEPGTALCIYPTKSLAHDQYDQFERLITSLSAITPNRLSLGVYDGDTPLGQRTAIRQNANVILTNPDMLHMGILPHHTNWSKFFQRLRYVVLDEAHHYRGVFGSHIANILRRLKRVANFYGGFPQFIFTSASISNPIEMSQAMLEESVDLISEDGAEHGKRIFILYNPPVVDLDLGLRKSAVSEVVTLSKDLLSNNIQTILFIRSRKGVESLIRLLRSTLPFQQKNIHGYRSGYLPSERREIEGNLRDGTLKMVVSTNALELGVDIGKLDAVLVVGYPGSISSFRQQSGRVGRRNSTSLTLMISSANPMDQYIIRHPEYLLDQNPESVYINPDNPLILLNHIRSALFELPFADTEGFGHLQNSQLGEYFMVLSGVGEAQQSGNRVFWMGSSYPADSVSIRNAGGEIITLQARVDGKDKRIAMLDKSSATWMAHPGAIYVHDGEPYEVIDINFEDNIANLQPANGNYETEPVIKSSVEKISELQKRVYPHSDEYVGEILVTSQVVGYRKYQWLSREIVGSKNISMPENNLRTVGYWLVFQESVRQALLRENLRDFCGNNYGPNWTKIRNEVRKRDRYRCQICGVFESDMAHDVHHKIPFRTFTDYETANRLDNLVTLCASCHRKVEQNVRVQSGLSGLAYIVHHLSPVFLMCDFGDLGVIAEPESKFADGDSVMIVYDQIPGGIGLAENMLEKREQILKAAFDLVNACGCSDGCPSCVGPGGENGYGGKKEVKTILGTLIGAL